MTIDCYIILRHILWWIMLVTLFLCWPTAISKMQESGAKPDVFTSTLYLPTLVAKPLEQPPYRAWSSPIAVVSSDSIWVVNPEAGTVTRVSHDATQKSEVAVGREPWAIAVAPNGQEVYVADRAQGTLVTLDAATQRVITTTAIGSVLGLYLARGPGRIWTRATVDSK